MEEGGGGGGGGGGGEPGDGTRELTKAVLAVVVDIVAELCTELAVEVVTNEVVTLMSELVASLAARLGQDLEKFAAHAKRKTISVDDVLLCARRNASLQQQLLAFMEAVKISRTRPRKAKRTAPEAEAPEGAEAEREGAADDEASSKRRRDDPAAL